MVVIHDDMELEGLVFFFAFDHHYTIRVVLCFFTPAGGDSYLRDGPPGPQLYASVDGLEPPPPNYRTAPNRLFSTPAFRFSPKNIPLSGTHGPLPPLSEAAEKFSYLTPFPSVVKQST